MRSSLWIIFCLLIRVCAGIAQEEQANTQNPPDRRDQNLPSTNPYNSPGDIERGRQYFLGHCALCHGPEGEGGRGVNLTTGIYRHGSSDRELYMTLRKGVAGSEMPGSRLSQPELWRLVAYVRRIGAAGAEEKASGDPRAGLMIYEGKGGCPACHMVNGRGATLGPDLSRIGLRRSLRFLQESILDPSAYVSPEDRTATVVTRDGGTIRGAVLNEDDYSIQLRDTRGELHSFPNGNLIEVKREKESLMPSYKSTLSKAEVSDLVAYLNSLRGKP